MTALYYIYDNVNILCHILFVLVFLSALAMSRQKHLHDNIRTYRLQSLAIFFVILVLLQEHYSMHLMVSGLIVLLFKVFIFPLILTRISNKLHIKDHFENSFNVQVIFVLIGAITMLCFILFPYEELNFLPILTYHVIPIAVAISFMGLVLMINRSKTLSQILGFLVMENGINLLILFGASGFSSVLEFGLALDLLIGVLIMGVFTNRIKENVDHIDASQLKALKD